jgi:hypothetical protein
MSSHCESSLKLRAGDIHSNARYFREAASHLYSFTENDGIANGLIIPAIVCLAFSIELELKAILVQLDSGRRVNKEHRLDELFEYLPDALKTEIFELCKDGHPNFVYALGEEAKAFVMWRYSHEHGLLRANTKFLLDLSNACAFTYGKLTQKESD